MEQAVQVKQQPVWWGILKKMINFIYKKILIAWNRANMHSPYPANLVNMLGHVHKMPVQVGQTIKRYMLFLTCTHLGISQKKKTKKHSSNKHIKSLPMICVNS